MTNGTLVKTVVCGVALVSVFSVRAASAQVPGSCNPGEGSGSGGAAAAAVTSEDCTDSDSHTFSPGGDTEKFEFDFGTGTPQLSLQITANVPGSCGVFVEAEQISPQDFAFFKTSLNFPAAQCIPVMSPNCVVVHVFDSCATPTGLVHYKYAWITPPISNNTNPRLLRGPLFSQFEQDITTGVNFLGTPTSPDAAVSGDAGDFSDYGAVSFPVHTVFGKEATVWVGLANSDDVGIRFDLRAEVYRNGTAPANLISSGELASATGGSSGFSNARLDQIFLSDPTTPLSSGNTAYVKLFVRNACEGSGKNSGKARLWFNDAAADSRFSVAAGGSPTFYLTAPTGLSANSPGTGPKTVIDVQSGAKCSAYKLFGTWSGTVP